MGEEKKNPQKLKRIEAAAYDYDSDPRWADYWSNILIPSHMASRYDVVDHFERKFYQRYIDPNLVVEAMPSSKPSQSAKPFASSSTSSACDGSDCRLISVTVCFFLVRLRKTGGNFKEKLRELGGLDDVFEVAMECHSIMEEV
ncbi:hypothetical protein V6N13_036725 [Hibiscus sabdariffa]